ncbi:redoxin domain-containing protein [Paenibacillus piri]|nr:redoxin domain-containing protein [Paenibacillus piri]
MDTWILGPLVLQNNVWMTAAAVAAGLGAMKLYVRRGQDSTTKSYDRVYEALLIWLLVWKLSMLLTDFQSVWESPISLLYFSGGVKGAWIAAAVVVGYVWLRDHSSPEWGHYKYSWLVSLLVGYTIYRLLEIVFEEVSFTTNGLLVILGVATLLYCLKGQAPEGRRTLQQLFLIYVLGHALISAVAANTWEKPGFGGNPAYADAATGLRIGQRAPDFELESLEGGTIKKLSDFRGQKVLINFWATWCPPCQVEMPHMERFYSEYKDRDVVILSVNATQTEASKVVVKAFAAHWELTFPIVLDTLGEVGKTYNVSAYPATYIIDEQGIIRKKVQGPMNEDSLRKAVR